MQWAAVRPAVVVGGRWHCVEFSAGHDLLVINQLSVLGFEVFFPKYLPAKDKPLAPALGRYLFVRFDQSLPHWRAIPGLLGVVRLFSLDAERPMVIPDREIEALRAKFGADGEATRPAPPPAPLPVGCLVRVSAGPLVGYLGQVEASDGRTVRIGIVGRAVTMAQAAVEAMGPSQP